MSSISILQARTPEELACHADEWDRLALAAPERHPMLSYAWVATFFEHRIDARSSWLCLFAYDGQYLIGVLPVVRRGRLLGTQLSAPYDEHTRSGHPLLAVGREHEALAALLEALSVAEPRHVSIRFYGIRAGSPTLAAESAIPARVKTLSSIGGRGSVIPTSGSFAGYEDTLNSNFRRNLRKARNRCTKAHETAFHTYSGPDAAAPHLLQQFLEVEAAGWKGAAGTAIKCSADLVAFYTALAHRLSERRWLEWHFLELDGAPAAGHFAIRFGRSLVLPKIGYDEQHARLAPGNMLFHQIAAESFADPDTDEINCLTDMEWHANWHVMTEEYSDMIATPHQLLPSALGILEVELPAAALTRAKDSPWLVKRVRQVKAVRKRR
jgi:CelD/BcsL family acetyltransferase involved in cellulose biosynthesis